VGLAINASADLRFLHGHTIKSSKN
jgi:hypothetical protein